ncbi:PTS system sucrose-specific IIB / IIC component [Vibrio variabilis]|uniref:PTS system sucrose-specific IIB / IIC component n=1 Tax=Vibrio variabilis TaxID=990271 RepID=A0ABQ0J711_9VIBR|nr:PTS system sucrose-specific IIB / IIC component [Vibrio variabilis]
MPESLDLVMTPFLTLLIMSAVSLLAVGPLFHVVEVTMVETTKYLLELPFGLSGLFVGFVWDLIVITGVHHVFNLLEIQLLANEGSNVFNALITGAISAQGAACLAVGIKTKSKKMKALCFPSTVSAFLGIIEPAIFGVNLRYYRPFIFGLIGGAAGGFTAQILGLSASGMAITALPGALLYLDGQILSYFLVHAVSCVVAFSLTYSMGFSDKMLEKK